jgi:hypothetical protein
LQTLKDISNQQSSTVIFPLPLDLITPLLDSAANNKSKKNE